MTFDGKYFSIMHVGIQKFSKKVTGVYVRTRSSTSFTSKSLSTEILSIPSRLTEIDGGSLNAQKLVHYIINTLSTIRPIKCIV